jgi:CRISPR system Cascade subunit CasD
MGKPVLLLRLEGPLQSWGTRSRWDVRDTAPEPTKSGIIGLLGCALGYCTGDERLTTELDAGLRFGVRVEHPGSVLSDYQTISDFLPTAEGTYRYSGVKTSTSLQRLRDDPEATPATILSPRAYLEDAAFLVALEETGVAAGLLQKCEAALRTPVWPLYLGRKACIPTRPLLEGLTGDYSDIKNALERHPWSWRGTCGEQRQLDPRRTPTSLSIYLEDEQGDYVRQDVMLNNAARTYGFRRVTNAAARWDDVKPGAHDGGAS